MHPVLAILQCNRSVVGTTGLASLIYAQRLNFVDRVVKNAGWIKKNTNKQQQL